LRGQRRHHTGFPLSSASPGSDTQNLDGLMRRAPDAEVKKPIRISLWVWLTSASCRSYLGLKCRIRDQARRLLRVGNRHGLSAGITTFDHTECRVCGSRRM